MWVCSEKNASPTSLFKSTDRPPVPAPVGETQDWRLGRIVSNGLDPLDLGGGNSNIL